MLDLIVPGSGEEIPVSTLPGNTGRDSLPAEIEEPDQFPALPPPA